MFRNATSLSSSTPQSNAVTPVDQQQSGASSGDPNSRTKSNSLIDLQKAPNSPSGSLTPSNGNNNAPTAKYELLAASSPNHVTVPNQSSGGLNGHVTSPQHYLASYSAASSVPSLPSSASPNPTAGGSSYQPVPMNRTSL